MPSCAVCVASMVFTSCRRPLRLHWPSVEEHFLMHATAIARVPRRAIRVCGLLVRFNRIRCTLSLTLRTMERHKTRHAAFDVNPIITCDLRRAQMLSRLTHLAARMAPAPLSFDGHTVDSRKSPNNTARHLTLGGKAGGKPASLPVPALVVP